ncbi:hypothetical protein ACT29H_02715 [Thermophagus sp. OGC60D27]|uniref:hypothetical protein n=1 Tax=Thermophagus sp. OGC60D27 TaxID=3458415 RepID=UPI0040377714
MLKNKVIPFFIFFSCFLVSLPVISQVENNFRYYYPDFEPERSNELLLHIANVNFVKDNEYKNHFAWGHTLIGYGLQPSLMYYAGDRLRLMVGVFVQQYSGLNYYSEVKPVLSAHLRLSSSVDVIMGALRGHLHHNLIEPLFDPERQYTRPVENGIQFLVDGSKLKSDMWVDWEQFIREGDDFPEWFTAGMNTEYLLRERTDESPWSVTLPIQIIATHRGGEVSNYPERVQTSLNLATGIKTQHFFEGALNSIGLFGYGISYRNLNDAGPLGINNGSACYMGVTASTKRLNLMTGYFCGKDFVSLRGSGNFQSVSPIHENVYVSRRQLMTLKIGYNRTFLDKIKFSFLFEGYFDVKDRRFDFAPGMQVVFSPSFFLLDKEFF